MQHLSLTTAFTVTTVLLHQGAAAIEPYAVSKTITNLETVARTIASNVTVQNNSYLFSITLPSRREQRFAQLSFSFTTDDQTKEVAIPFDLSGIKVATQSSKRWIGIERTWIDETGTLWIEFQQPVAAGTALTVTLKTRSQLRNSTSYRYGIAAYPNTQNPVPVFVGDGKLTSQGSR